MAGSFFTGNYALLRTGSENFSTKISAQPLVYGLSAALATSYASLHSVYADAYDATLNPDTLTKGKIALRNQTAIPLRALASDLAKIVEGTPSVNDDQKTSLGLNVRSQARPVEAPGTPTALVATLDGNGDVKIQWKCSNPPNSQGTMYQIWRRIGPTADYQFLAGVGRKKYTDTSVPAGSVSVSYMIQAVRSTAVGEWATFTIAFGKNLDGEATATLVDASSAQLKAA